MELSKIMVIDMSPMLINNFITFQEKWLNTASKNSFDKLSEIKATF